MNESQTQVDKDTLRQILTKYEFYRHKKTYGKVQDYEEKNLRDRVESYLNSLD